MRMRVLGAVVSTLLGGTAVGGGHEPRCQPTAGGPHWLLEGEALAVKVSCATGWEPPGAAFKFESLPPGARYDTDSATLHWTPGLDQAAVYALEVRGPGGERGTVKVGVADNWESPDNVPVADLSRYTEEYGLPVFHIQGASGLNPDSHVPIVVTYQGHAYAAEGKLSGSSSLAFPKNSYTVKFSAADPFNAPELGGGFTQRRSLALVNTFNDNSYLRARLGFELWSRLSPDALQVKAFSAVVFLDGAYHGLYTVADHVDEHLMAAQGLSRDGNLYKADTGSANFKLTDAEGRTKRRLHLGFEKQDGEPGAFEDLDGLTLFVATSSAGEFRTQAPQRIRLRDYEDGWAFVTLLGASGSDIKNAYHYHDPQGGPWRYIPGDLDGTFGQSSRTQRLRPTTPLGTGAENGLFGRILAEPTLAGPLRARLKAALSAELSPALLQARLDALAREVRPSARRDERRWGARYRSFPLWSFREDFTTFDEEVEYLRQWIALRWAFLELRLTQPPSD